MASSQSLAVGLAIGIPSFLILVFVGLFWLRNYRKQKKEDSAEHDIDLALRDDQSFSQFEAEPQNKAKAADNVSVKEKTVNSSNDSNSTHSKEEMPQTPNHKSEISGFSQPSTPFHGRKGYHSKTSSSYDLYENFIPILAPGKIEAEHSDVPSANTSSASLGQPDRSLDNLAKQLNSSGLFEKLPKVAPPSPFKNHTNNSSSEVLNGLIQPDGINERYIYETHARPKATPLDGAIEANFDADPDGDAVVFKRFQNSGPAFSYADWLYNRTTAYVALGLGGFYLYNLDEAPFTGRWRFLWIPYWLEKRLGDMSYRQMTAQFQANIVPASDPVYRRISKIMNRLLTAAIEGSTDQRQIDHLKSLPWAIHVVKVDANEVPPNAFILPNGKIFIFSSILPICENDDGLATVLSHELSHQLAHHSSEQLSKQPFLMALSTLLYLSTGVSWLNDLVIDGFIAKPASREMESEADHIGCELMARSCFNLGEAVRFWSRMERYEGSAGARSSRMLEFFSTHPNSSKRIHDIQAWMPDLVNIREAAGCHDHVFSGFNDLQRDFFRR